MAAVKDLCTKKVVGYAFSSRIDTQLTLSALVHLRRYAPRRAAQADIFAYIEAFYNTLHPHSAIGWLSPCAFELRLRNASVA